MIKQSVPGNTNAGMMILIKSTVDGTGNCFKTSVKNYVILYSRSSSIPVKSSGQNSVSRLACCFHAVHHARDIPSISSFQSCHSLGISRFPRFYMVTHLDQFTEFIFHNSIESKEELEHPSSDHLIQLVPTSTVNL